LGNAIKFTPAGGGIKVYGERFSEEFWLIGVCDSGEGIHSEELEFIFEKFVQSARQREKNQDGTGLGLSICRGIIDAHQGRIWAESPGPGQGSTFYFTLPVYQDRSVPADANA
jgi:signal transduction histidine kinase